MQRFLLTILLLATSGVSTVFAQSPSNQHYEFRQYVDVAESRLGELDSYLEKALLPALNKLGHENVGVWSDKEAKDGKVSVFVLIPFRNAEEFAVLNSKLAADEAYLSASEEYSKIDPKNPLFARVRSEFLVAFNCWPELKVPAQHSGNKPRLFELRTYESATEHRGVVKVEMFNSGEVPIFLDSGVVPVFFGQALVSDVAPSLTYLTVYDNAEARDAAWKKFVAHPDWKKLSAEPKYQNTVSKIHKRDLLPRPYSQL